jgi:hypothetical protein
VRPSSVLPSTFGAFFAAVAGGSSSASVAGRACTSSSLAAKPETMPSISRLPVRMLFHTAM